jgi:NAD+--asparagine ADP-ribosyltransferase
MFKTCPQCKTEKPHSEYHFDKHTKSKLSCYCKSCKSAYINKNRDKILELKRKHYLINKERRIKMAKEWQKNNKDKYTKITKNSSLKRNYGISLDDYNNLLLKQNNKCVICQIDANSLAYKLAVDHNHLTKKVRGLLCHNCNRALGGLKVDSNPENIIRALNYLSEILILEPSP